MMKNLCLIVLCLIFGACARPQYGQPISMTNDGGRTTYLYGTEAEAVDSWTSYSLACKTPGMCPENVGTLVLKLPEAQIIICTFSLIADDVAITNRHCITDDLAHNGATCSGQIKFLLMQHGSAVKNDAFDCDHVMSVPAEYKDKELIQRDFAVFKIRRTKPAFTTDDPRILPFKFDQSGVPDDESFHVIVTDPDHVKFDHSTIREQICTSIVSPYISDYYEKATDPLIVFRNCELIHGNSGSPVLDSNYKIRAIMNESREDTPPDPKASEDIAAGGISRQQVHVDGYVNAMKIAFGINLYCVDIPELGIKIGSEAACKVVHDANIFAQTDPLLQPSYLPSFEARLNAMLPTIQKNAPVFEWEWVQRGASELNTEGANHRMRTEFIPGCFSGIYDHFTWNPLVNTPDANGISTYTLDNIPVDLVDTDVNPQLKESLVLTSKMQSLKISFNYNDLVSSPIHSTKATIERSGYIVTKATTETLTLEFCQYYVTTPPASQ